MKNNSLFCVGRGDTGGRPLLAPSVCGGEYGWRVMASMACMWWLVWLVSVMSTAKMAAMLSMAHVMWWELLVYGGKCDLYVVVSMSRWSLAGVWYWVVPRQFFVQMDTKVWWWRRRSRWPVYWQLVTHQFDAHLELFLRASCMLMVVTVVNSEAFRISKSLAWRAQEVSRKVGGDVIYEDDKENGGNYSLWDSFLYLDGMVQAVVELNSRCSVVQEALNPVEHLYGSPCSWLFHEEAFNPHLVRYLWQVHKVCNDFLLVLKCVFCHLINVYELTYNNGGWQQRSPQMMANIDHWAYTLPVGGENC